jgi:Predicted nucleotide-binding protein containing TIR -like domain
MKFALVPVSLSEKDRVHLERAARCVSTVQNTFSFKMSTPQAFESFSTVPWPTDFSILESCGANVIGITSKPFKDNWFSHSTRGVSIISTNSWSDVYAPPGLASFLMMEIACAVYVQIADAKEENLQPHERSIGCLLDMCANKPEISWKLRCGSLCAEHEGSFRQYGGSARQLQAIQRILEACRLTAFGRLAFDDLPEIPETYRVFIGSSGELKNVAYAVQQCLESEIPEVLCNVWTDGVFTPSSDFMSALINMAHDVDFAILVAGRDDVATWRGEKVSIPRDNVTFELGLFMGVVGKERTFLVCPENTPKLPSDLSGFVHVRYRERPDNNWEAAVRPGMTQLARSINSAGRRDRWNAYIAS